MGGGAERGEGEEGGGVGAWGELAGGEGEGATLLLHHGTWVLKGAPGHQHLLRRAADGRASAHLHPWASDRALQ